VPIITLRGAERLLLFTRMNAEVSRFVVSECAPILGNGAASLSGLFGVLSATLPLGKKRKRRWHRSQPGPKEDLYLIEAKLCRTASERQKPRAARSDARASTSGRGRIVTLFSVTPIGVIWQSKKSKNGRM